MKFLILFLVVLCGGCSTSQEYDPLASSRNQEFLLNKSSFDQIKEGMTQSQVHQIMGESLVIGYSSKHPLTINNPYKAEELKAKDGQYTIEYYVSSAKVSDGALSDDEMIPFVFRDGLLLSRGWDALKALRLKNPS